MSDPIDSGIDSTELCVRPYRYFEHYRPSISSVMQFLSLHPVILHSTAPTFSDQTPRHCSAF